MIMSETGFALAESLILSDKELDAWRDDGYVVREAVFSGPELQCLREGAESAARQALALTTSGRTYFLDGKRFVDVGHMTVQFEHSAEGNVIRVIEPVHELAASLDALIDDLRITVPMRTLVGSEEIALWTDKLNLKRAGVGSGFGWHQDSPYWVHDCSHVDRLPNVFLNFDDADAGNGCLRIVRGSHKRGCLPGCNDGTRLGGFFTDPSAFDECDAVDLEVPAGSLVFFNPHAVHGSSINCSSRPRRAIILTYQPAGFPTLKAREYRNV